MRGRHGTSGAALCSKALACDRAHVKNSGSKRDFHTCSGMHDLVLMPVLQDESDELIPLEDVLPACMAEFVVPPPDAGR
jgi:hypothetical protein